MGRKPTEKYKIIDNDPMSREFNGYLVINWKTGEARAIRIRPTAGNVSPFDIVTQYCIRVTTPQPDIIMNAEVTLTHEKTAEIFTELL